MTVNIIEVKNLTKRYGARIALHDVSFDVKRGEIFGILGPNGAGKSTTVECLAGLREPDSGTMTVLGYPVADRRLREVVGVQLQDAQLPDKMRVAEALDLFASFYPRPANPSDLMAELDLSDHAAQAFAKLSGGQRQRLSIALALIGNPTVVILDELTTGLDPIGRREAWGLVQQIRDRGVTVLLITHFMDEAERLCDRVALLNHGRVVALDTPAGLIRRAAQTNLEDAYVALTASASAFAVKE